MCKHEYLGNAVVSGMSLPDMMSQKHMKNIMFLTFTLRGHFKKFSKFVVRKEGWKGN